MLIRGAGVVPHIPPFEERYGMKGAVVAAAGLIIGIGKMCGLEHLPVEGEDIEDPPKRVRAKVKRAIDALQTHDFVLLNIKGADEAGHDGDFDKKMRFLEDTDDAFKPLFTLKDTLIIITADHSTPVASQGPFGRPGAHPDPRPGRTVRHAGTLQRADRLPGRAVPHPGHGRHAHRAGPDQQDEEVRRLNFPAVSRRAFRRGIPAGRTSGEQLCLRPGRLINTTMAASRERPEPVEQYQANADRPRPQKELVVSDGIIFLCHPRFSGQLRQSQVVGNRKM